MASERARGLSNCRSCGASIVWVSTASGRKMPIDNTPAVLPDDTRFDSSRHVSHFSTCPNADQHRKPRQPRAQK